MVFFLSHSLKQRVRVNAGRKKRCDAAEFPDKTKGMHITAPSSSLFHSYHTLCKCVNLLYLLDKVHTCFISWLKASAMCNT